MEEDQSEDAARDERARAAAATDPRAVAMRARLEAIAGSGSTARKRRRLGEDEANEEEKAQEEEKAAEAPAPKRLRILRGKMPVPLARQAAVVAAAAESDSARAHGGEGGAAGAVLAVSSSALAVPAAAAPAAGEENQLVAYNDHTWFGAESLHAKEVLQGMISGKAFAESGSFSQLPPDIPASTVRQLVDSGTLATREAPGGIVEYALRAKAVKVEGIMLCAGFRGVNCAPLPVELPITSWPKLACAAKLLQNGWQTTEDTPVSLPRQGSREFSWSAIDRPRSYWQVLCSADYLFAKNKTLELIMHGCPDSYYQCLLRLDDLTTIEKKTPEQLLALGDGDFRSILKKNGQEALQALEDEERRAALHDDAEPEPPPQPPVPNPKGGDQGTRTSAEAKTRETA